jgi:hypothetical protein
MPLLTLLATVLFALSIPRSANAEWYWFKDAPQDSAETAQTVSQPTHAQRFFGRLESKNDVDYFSFSAKKDTRLDVQLEIPSGDPNFKPTLILFGPDLPKPASDPVIPIGETNGATVSSDTKDRTTRYDNYLFTSFLEGAHITQALPDDATYGIAIRSPDGNRGRYVLKIGGEDPWNWNDWNELFDRISGIFRAILRIY